MQNKLNGKQGNKKPETAPTTSKHSFTFYVVLSSSMVWFAFLIHFLLTEDFVIKTSVRYVFQPLMLVVLEIREKERLDLDPNPFCM